MTDPTINSDGSGLLSNITTGWFNGVGDQRNPTLVPMYDHTAMINGSQNTLSVAEYLDEFPQVAASETVTLGGTVTSTDTVSITGTNASESSTATVTYTVGSTDTADSIANGLADGISANSTLSDFIEAYSSSGVITVTAINPGPGGNSIKLAVSKSSGATETITLGNSNGNLSGGSGPIIPLTNFEFMYNGTLMNFWRGIPEAGVSNDMVAMLASLGVI